MKKKKEKMSLRWLEAALPLGIIAGMLCVMGNAQYFIHKAYHGRVRPFSPFYSLFNITIDVNRLGFDWNYLVKQPKHIGNDMWDVAMERRDKKLFENLSASASSSTWSLLTTGNFFFLSRSEISPFYWSFRWIFIHFGIDTPRPVFRLRCQWIRVFS